jgi:hypothetical protein
MARGRMLAAATIPAPVLLLLARTYDLERRADVGKAFGTVGETRSQLNTRAQRKRERILLTITEQKTLPLNPESSSTRSRKYSCFAELGNASRSRSSTRLQCLSLQ